MYYVHSENFTENELIIDHVQESREINYLFHESREYFCSRITGNNFVLSRFTAIRNRHSRFPKNPLSDPHLWGVSRKQFLSIFKWATYLTYPAREFTYAPSYPYRRHLMSKFSIRIQHFTCLKNLAKYSTSIFFKKRKA